MSRQVRRSALRWAAGVVAGGLLAATGAAPALAAPSPLEPQPAARPHPHVTLAAPGRVPPAAQVAVTGQVGPAHPGRRLQLQARVAGHWRPVATTTLTRRSTYTFRRTLTATTTLRVVLPAHSDHRAGVSRVRAVRVVAAGFDVSYPQCGRPLPTGATAAVVGVDGGKPFDVNPCLAEQVAWASEASGTPAYYVNTANPGPRLSQFWPVGQAAPRACATSYPADDSTACAYDYGWNAAESSYQRAAAAAAVAGAPAVNRSTWWLDVELRNTWESDEYGETAPYLANDLAVLHGMAARLAAHGVRTVGVYSTVQQWARITGGARWRAAPVWYAGVGSPTTALAHCGVSFTGGPVLMAQYASRPPGFDADHRC